MDSRFCGWAALVCLAISGCGGGSTYKPPSEVYPVSGTVTYNGQPVAGATVTFFAAEAQRTAAGMTNDQGVYRLTTFTSNDGAVVGKQSVTVTKGNTAQAEPLPDDQSPNYDPLAVMRSAPTVKPPIPEKYATQTTSELEATVSAEGKNEFDFELKD